MVSAKEKAGLADTAGVGFLSFKDTAVFAAVFALEATVEPVAGFLLAAFEDGKGPSIWDEYTHKFPSLSLSPPLLIL